MTYKEAADKLATFSELEPGWDSYGAKEIDNWCIARAAGLLLQWAHLPVIEVTPETNGGVQIIFEGPPCMTIWIEPMERP